MTISTTKLKNLSDISVLLLERGYNASSKNDILTVSLFEGYKPVFFQVDEDRKDLVISAHIAELGELDEDRVPEFMAASLVANYAIAPFAYSFLTDIDGDGIQDDPSKWTVALVTRVPLSDFSGEELEYYTSRLISALLFSRDVVSTGLVQIK